MSTPPDTRTDTGDVASEAERAASNPENLCGPYVLLEVLGQGGMGTVYRAWDTRHRREVAVKQLRDPSERTRARLAREVEATARLRHPHIVALLDSGEAQGRPFLVTELVEGPSLAARAKATPPLPAEEAVRLMRQVAEAVATAHEAGVLHRDLKPHNVLIDRDGRAKVLDFGLARLLDVASDLTREGTTIGTLAFMPPEQVGAGGQPLDERCDVYSLGATLYYALTARTPFTTTTRSELLAQMASRTPDPPSRFNGEVSAALDAVCMRCLSKSPGDRYPSAQAVAAALLAAAVTPERSSGFPAALAVGLPLAVGLLALVVAFGPSGPRTAQETWHRTPQTHGPTQVALLLDAAERQPGFDVASALTRLGDAPDPEQEQVLIARLETWTQQQRAAERAAFLEVRTPTAAEARADGRVLSGLRAALERRDAGAPLGADDRQVLRQARGRLIERMARATPPRRERLEAWLAARQAAALGPGGLRGRRFAALGLGRVGGAASVAPLQRALGAERDPLRAVLPARALCQLATRSVPGALEALLTSRTRFGRLGPFARRIDPLVDRLRSEESDDVERGLRLLRQGRPRDALTAFDRAASSDRDNAALWTYRAAARRGLGEHELSLSSLERALRLTPSAPAAWIERGRALLALARHTEAEAAFARATQLAPRDPAAWRGRGQARGKLAQPAKALTDFDAALRLDPDDADALYGAGAARHRLGDSGGALAVAERLLALQPQGARGLLLRGTVKQAQGDLKGALADFDRAVRIDGNSVWAWNNRGFVRERLGELHSARTDYDRAIELDPTFAPAWTNRGNVNKRLRKWREALRDHRRAAKLRPQDAAMWVNLGSACGALQDHAAALKHFARALSLDPNHVVARLNLARTRWARGELKVALAEYDALIKQRPNEPRGWRGRASIHERLGRRARAEADLDQALRLAPRDVEGWLKRAGLRGRRGKAKAALADYEHAVKLAPGNARAWFGRAQAKRRLEDRSGAMADLQRAVELDRTLLQAWVHLAVLRLEEGDKQGAQRALDRATRLKPNDPYVLFNQARMFLAQGSRDRARGALQRFLDVAPKNHPLTRRARQMLRRLGPANQ